MLRPLVAAVTLVLLAVPGALRADPPVNRAVAARTMPAPVATAKSPAPRPAAAPSGAAVRTAAPAAPTAARARSAEAGLRAGMRRLGFTADSIVVEKWARRLTLFAAGGTIQRSYEVALGQNPLGTKQRAGDNRTPEGLYHIDARNPQSRFHLGLHVSYPNAQDLARARAEGVPPGGDIMIHGLPNGQERAGASHRAYDWTNGCVAVTDDEIEEIWSAVPVGTPVRILP